MSKQPSRVVFVGNIPYGLSEEQISDIFSSAGTVINFRLVYDRETGRPKGFGFAEYPDADSASSAVRNLNDYEIMGRKLRVDFSNEPGGDGGDSGEAHGGPSGGNHTYNNNHNSNGMHNPVPAQQQTGSSLPPLPPGKELPPGVTCTDAISRTLNTLPPSQLLDILAQMKTLATTEPHRATELLQQAPQLTYAIFQALLLMGLVQPDAIQSVIDPNGPAPLPVPPPAQNVGYAPPPVSNYPPPANNTPPVVGGAYIPPPVQSSQPYGAPPPGIGSDADQLMQQVLMLPQEAIDQLPEVERAQIMALRAGAAAQRR